MGIQIEPGSFYVHCFSAVGIDYITDCNCDVTGEFWHEFSALFAQVASDNALFLGNGERSFGAYSNQSYFATVEIPNMIPGKVKRVVALIVHRRGKGQFHVVIITMQ